MDMMEIGYYCHKIGLEKLVASMRTNEHGLPRVNIRRDRIAFPDRGFAYVLVDHSSGQCRETHEKVRDFTE